jgi:hypothetical protein
MLSMLSSALSQAILLWTPSFQTISSKFVDFVLLLAADLPIALSL